MNIWNSLKNIGLLILQIHGYEIKNLQERQKKRDSFFLKEEFLLTLNLILKDPNFNNSVRWKSKYKITKLRHQSKVKLSKICVLTGRSSNFNKKFRFSRLKFFDISRRALVSGLIKMSW